MIPIESIYVAYQGEGTRAGIKTIFLRVAGCNFFEDIPSHPCSYCDTSYAWNKDSGQPATVDQIIDSIREVSLKTGTKEICLTGGEPLSHPECRGLIEKLEHNYSLVIETNGSYPLWETSAMWSMDIKTPSSGNDKYNCYDNIRILKQKDQLKFVISDRSDFDFYSEVVKRYPIFCPIIFQPAWRQLSPKKLISWMKKDEDLSSVRIGLQQQKVIFGGTRKRV